MSEDLATDDQPSGMSAEEMAEAIERQRQEQEEREAAARAAREAAEEEERKRIAAEREEMQAQALAQARDEAEAENEARDALAASIAAMVSATAGVKPTPLPGPAVDVFRAPHGRLGPTIQAELKAAGVADMPFIRLGDHVTFSADIPAADRARVVAVITAHDPDQVEAVDLVAYAKAARDRHEEGGITVGGVPVATDDRSKTLLTGARLRVEKDPALVTSFAALDGQVYPLTAPMILAVSDAIGAFVAELFEAYAGIMADLKAGTIKTTAEIDARYGALDVAF